MDAATGSDVRPDPHKADLETGGSCVLQSDSTIKTNERETPMSKIMKVSRRTLLSGAAGAA
nr:hypothetical protein [Afipia sp.]